VQFLNDLYHHLFGLTQQQAEQHLTYYAEMLADRMEEGMSEEEAVAGMEDVETIARRIMEGEGLPYTPPEKRPPVPPEFPDASRLGGGGFTKAYQTPKRRGWKKAAQAALWAVAAIVAIGAITTFATERRAGHRYAMETSAIPEDIGQVEAVEETWAYTDGPYDAGYDYTEGERSYTSEDINLINIEWTAGMVYLQTYGGNDVMVQEFSESELNDRTRMKCVSADGKLDISYRNGGGLWNVKGSKWLTVLLPEGLRGEINVQTASADVQALGLELDTLRLNTVSGSVTCQECYVQTSELTTVSGNLTITQLYADRLDLSTASGYVNGELQCKELSAGSVSGDMNLNLFQYTENIKLNTTSGDLWASVEDLSVTGIEASSVSGDISLSLPYELGYTLDYSSVSGEAELMDTEGKWVSLPENGQYAQNGGRCQITVNTTSGDLDIY